MDILEAAFRAKRAGDVEMPPKVGVHPREDAFIHAMPAYLADTDAVGLKWVAGYPSNQPLGIPTSTACSCSPTPRPAGRSP